MHRALFRTGLVLAAAAAARGEDRPPAERSVIAPNGVVVHGVDTKIVSARLRDADRKAAAGDVAGAASALAEVLAVDANALIEDGESSYLCAHEAALQRIAALPPEGLDAYRKLADPQAAEALAAALRDADTGLLARRAPTMALTTSGPSLLVTLADLRAARGDVRGAAQALSDLLRLWPEGGTTEVMPGVDRAAAVARLASLLAALGDADGVAWLSRDCSAALLARPGVTRAGATLRDDLEFCARATAASPCAAPVQPGPPGELRVAADRTFTRSSSVELDVTSSREIAERPIPIGTSERPMLLTREPASGRGQARLLALTPGAPDPSGTKLAAVWSWPPTTDLQAGLRRGGRGSFAPVRCGDLVLFTWPAAPSAMAQSADETDERSTLVALSVRAEGRLVDERGSDEELRREDGDAELLPRQVRTGEEYVTRPGLSFCGRPLVAGESVYATLVRRNSNSDATELHLARFDLLRHGSTQRLVERWRRHLLDGIPLEAVSFTEEGPDHATLALASPMAERLGRIYVVSNTGAVACVDAADGTPLWLAAHRRLGPPPAHTRLPGHPRTWKDVPVTIDGPWVWAAPRDGEYLLQFRAMPRRARTTLVEAFRLHGGNATSTEQGPLLARFRPDEIVSLHQGIVWLSGGPEGLSPFMALAPTSDVLVSLRLREALPGERRRADAAAQVPDSAAAGSPCVVRGAILFPGYKAIYRVPLDDIESEAKPAWQPPAPPRGAETPDVIGNLVADGVRVWSVTPRRVTLLEPK